MVQRVSGQSLGQFLASRVFEPLNLDMAVEPGERAADVAVGYQQLNQQLAPVDPRWQQVGDGAVITTPTELARWGDNYRTGQIGGPQLLKAVTDGSVPTASDPHAP